MTNYTNIYNTSVTQLNTYTGGVYQQAVSALTTTDQTAYELSGGGFSVYGFEYKPGIGDAVCRLLYTIPIRLSLASILPGYQTMRQVGRC